MSVDESATASALLTIGEVAEQTGLSVHALRFYERQGILIDPVRRTSGGQRLYSEDDLVWLRLCMVLRASGMPVEDIRVYTELAREGEGTERDRLELLRGHQDRVRAQLRELKHCLDIITYKVRVYEDVVGE
ncbi:MerR family transcriptional regulator [Intrasporangium sp. YIM S08009]|uniref:MerR family transcriptional regulator n=1 Tax=Intrasporangium zincisolvens TaxID=3080018 RepID=UPI002B058943|nr:MerR family transcriptional regulator [Intrasporangium sp. YIM S08009]